MTEPQIHGIFPTPILIASLDRDFTADELAFFDEQSKELVTNAGNTTSKNNYVLRDEVMQDISSVLLSTVNTYMKDVLDAVDTVEPYITQSWLNYTKPGEFHHKHDHANSFLSGVLYVNAEPIKDRINFYDDEYRQIKIDYKNWNLWNSESWWFDIKPGDIVIFPSHLKHMVEHTISNSTRVSLAFNTFLRGTLGNNCRLTELLNP